MSSPDQIPPEERDKMQQVANAGAAAAVTAPEGDQQAAARAAMRERAAQVNLEITDEQIDQIASAVSAKTLPELIEGFRQAGAFDPPPEPPAAPPSAPPPPGDPAAAGTPPAEPTPAPKKRTWADRYFG